MDRPISSPFDPPGASVDVPENEQHPNHFEIAIRWGFIFSLPIFMLIAIQMLIINNKLNHGELPSRLALNLLSAIAGQLGILIGVFLSAMFIAWRRAIRFWNKVASAFVHGFGWIILFKAGWSIFLGLKFHRNIAIIFYYIGYFNNFRFLLKFWLILSLYAFLLVVSLDFRLRKSSHP